MPNPFVKLGQLNTSKEPSKRPEHVPPVPEEYEGDNNPYRGTESHGVERTVEPSETPGWEGAREGIQYAPEVPDEAPVPVRIVQQHGREFRKWRAHTATIQPATSVRFLGQNDARNSVTIYNKDDAESLFISPDQISAAGLFLTYEIEPNQEVVLNTQDDIHVYTDAVANVVVQAIETYSVEL